MRRVCRLRNPITLLVCLLGLGAGSSAAELKAETTAAFDRYVTTTEARFAGELRPGGTFLYVDSLQPDAMRSSYEQLKQGGILVERLETKAPGVSASVPDGIVHHWVGLIFIPGVTLANTLPVVQDYDHRAELYKPDVISSRMLGHEGSNFKIFLRLYQRKFTTVVFNSEYDIHWGQVDASKMYSNSISTRIAEVKNADQPEGEEDPVGTGHGYLWRLNTYWRFEEKDGGVYVQCEAVSLTRNIPFGLGWLLRPLVTSLPKESLNRALGRTREVILQQTHIITTTRIGGSEWESNPPKTGQTRLPPVLKTGRVTGPPALPKTVASSQLPV